VNVVLPILVAACVGAGIAAVFSLLLSRADFALDVPNGRSLHSRAVPRSGGIAILLGLVGAGAALFVSLPADSLDAWSVWPILAAVLLMGIVGLQDDLRGFHPLAKLSAQGIAAAIVVASGVSVDRVGLPGGGVLELGTAGLFLSWFWLVACANAVNFMDGADGLVAKCLIPAFLTLAGLCAFVGLWAGFTLAWAGAFALWGFYITNRPPARIFMGDSGSQSVGMLAGCLTLLVAQPMEERLSLAAVPLLLLPILFDSGFTLARRALSGEAFWRPHRTHLFQLALRAGMAPLLVSRIHLGMTLIAMASAIGMTQAPSPWHQAFVLPPLLVQLLWLGHVDRLRRRAGLPWNEPGLRQGSGGKPG
jgi:UDP-GlcNAc:undecaprenyl-phosphate GlcNAc-1-phosphate transferase